MSEQITTAAELDALPVGSVVLDLGPDRAEANAPVIACKAADGMWWVAGTPRDRRWRSFEVIRDAEGSVLVCTHRPDAPVTAGAVVTREQVASLVEAALRLIGEAWDDGNAAGLDGWTGPGRGSGEVDQEAQHARTRMVHKADDVLTALGLTVVDGPTEGGA